jgi:hypothetical protein
MVRRASVIRKPFEEPFLYGLFLLEKYNGFFKKNVPDGPVLKTRKS